MNVSTRHAWEACPLAAVNAMQVRHGAVRNTHLDTFNVDAMSAVDNPPPPPPRSRARGTPKRPTAEKKGASTEKSEEPTDASESGDVFTDAPASQETHPEVERLQTLLVQKEEELAHMKKELEEAVSARDDVVERHTDWLKEREELRGEMDALQNQIASERERADAAEERVRDLRRTNEESRRAIMRLQQSRPGTPRTESETSERLTRRSSAILSSLAPRSISGASEADSETERTGLRDLRLVSPSQASTDGFSPVLGAKSPEEASVVPETDLPKEDTETVGAADEGQSPGHATSPSGITGLFPSSLLRPPFSLLRKSPSSDANSVAVAGSSEDATMQMEQLRSEHDKAQERVMALEKELTSMQDQLTESREAQQASETLIKSLREYIVNAGQGSSLPTDTPSLEEKAETGATMDVTENVLVSQDETESDAKPLTEADIQKEDPAVSATVQVDAEERAKETQEASDVTETETTTAKSDAATTEETEAKKEEEIVDADVATSST